MRIGILGGTFNPIHNGHISIALKVCEKFSLDKVLFMPNKIPPHKNSKDILNEDIRLEMINRAICDYSSLGVEEYELNKDTTSYTYESLEYLDRNYKGSELFFIIGSDSFLDFEKWQKINRVFRSATIIVYLREEKHKEEIFKLRDYYKEIYSGSIEIFLDKIIDVSSTEIRNKILNNEDISSLVPESVYDFIKSKNLYRE